MRFGSLRAMFLVPAERPFNLVKCVIHDRTFAESMDASFHESVNVGCEWEPVER